MQGMNSLEFTPVWHNIILFLDPEHKYFTRHLYLIAANTMVDFKPLLFSTALPSCISWIHR